MRQLFDGLREKELGPHMVSQRVTECMSHLIHERHEGK